MEICQFVFHKVACLTCVLIVVAIDWIMRIYDSNEQVVCASIHQNVNHLFFFFCDIYYYNALPIIIMQKVK